MLLALLAYWEDVIHCHPKIFGSIFGNKSLSTSRNLSLGKCDFISSRAFDFTFSIESIKYIGHVGSREGALCRNKAGCSSLKKISSTEVHLCERTVKFDGFRQCTIDFQFFTCCVECVAILVVGDSTIIGNLDVLQVIGVVAGSTFGLCPEHEIVGLALYEAECHLCFQVSECGSFVEVSKMGFLSVVLVN